MTLGTGIFLSSLLLGLILLFWITKDRVRWSRIIYWFAGAVAVIIGALFVYQNYESPPTKQFEYADLKLGMNQDEVNYIKGVPTDVMEDDGSNMGMRVIEVSKLEQGRKVSDFPYWSYQMPNERIDVDFGADKKVKSIQCYSTGFWNCPPVFDLRVGSSEEQVVARLGTPTTASVEGVTKQMVYPPYNVVFFLTKKKVYEIHVRSDMTTR